MREQIPVALVRRGEQYSLKIRLKIENEVITPLNCDSVRIKVGNSVSTSNIGLTFEDEYWLFPLSQEFTRSLEGELVPAQAQVKISGDIFETPVYLIRVGDSIFEDIWDESVSD